MKINKVFVLGALLCATSVSQAEIPVTSLNASESRLDRLERLVEARNDVQLLTRLNQLQQEVQLLRGMIEEQVHSIETLEKRQRALYADLDKRIEKLKTVAAQTPVDSLSLAPTNKIPTASLSQVATAPSLTLDINSSEATLTDKSAYQSAYAYIKSKSYPQAVSAFQDFLTAYPESDLIPNAHYWLGELFLLDRNHQQAITSFNRVVSDHSAHPKAADAMVKLGIVNLELGKPVEASQIFNQVKAQFPRSAASRIAEARLNALN